MEDCILSFLGPAAVEVLLKQVLPSIRRLRALRGLRIQPVRTTTLLVPIKVIITKCCYGDTDTWIVFLLWFLHRHSPTYAVVTLRKVRRKSNFVQVGIDYTYGQLCVCIQAVQLKSKLPTHRNLIGPSMTAPSPVLSPNIILPPPSSHCAFSHGEEKKSGEGFKNIISIFFYLFKNCVSLELRNFEIA